MVSKRKDQYPAGVQIRGAQQTKERTVEYSKQATTLTWNNLRFHLLILFLISLHLPLLFSSSLFLSVSFSSSLWELKAVWAPTKLVYITKGTHTFPILSYLKHGSCHQRKDVQVQKSCHCFQNLPLFSYLCISHNRSCRMETAEQVPM